MLFLAGYVSCLSAISQQLITAPISAAIALHPKNSTGAEAVHPQAWCLCQRCCVREIYINEWTYPDLVNIFAKCSLVLLIYLGNEDIPKNDH